MINEIQITIAKIIKVLSSNDVPDWAKQFERMNAYLDDDYEEALGVIHQQFGGMGSFNDIVLYKAGRPLIQENNELDELRTQLYELIFKAMHPKN